MSQQQNSTWKTQSGYVWSLIGSAVGFANIISFSAQAYKNGGGAFLIPYMIALFVLGIPMLFLEGIIGYHWKLPIVSIYGKTWGKMGKMLGWLSVLACLSIGGFYIVLTGYSVAYTYFSATNMIPEDTKNFFIQTVLQSTQEINDFGQLSIPIFFSTLAVAGIAWFVLVRNVRDGIEKVCTIFMPLLTLIMIAFAILVCFLPGGMMGWIYYLKPDFSRLLDPLLWRDVFGQLFFSLSLGLGIIVGYSRHTSEKTNISRAMIWMALGDFFVSFVAGFAVFGCLAHISYMQNIPFDSILTTDSPFEIGFILFPKMLKFFGPLFSQFIGIVFFFCIFVAGITGVFSIVESIAGNIESEFATSRKSAVTATIALLVGLGTLFCMGNASAIIDALVPMVLGTNMLIAGLALIIAFFYSSQIITKEKIHENLTHRFFSFALRYIAPTFLFLSLVGNLWQEFQVFDIAISIRWSWFFGAILSAAFLVYWTELNRKATSLTVLKPIE